MTPLLHKHDDGWQRESRIRYDGDENSGVQYLQGLSARQKPCPPIDRFHACAHARGSSPAAHAPHKREAVQQASISLLACHTGQRLKGLPSCLSTNTYTPPPV